MPGLLENVDPDGLLEYSVVYTDRAVNHMSGQFQSAMRDIHETLTTVYGAAEAVVLPGSGTSGMEAVARQLAHDKHCLVIRNGWFSFRWSQILERGRIPASLTVMKGQPLAGGSQSPFQPAPINTVVAAIRKEKPAVVFAPHVETSAGMMLPDDYLKAIAEAVHEVGGLFVLDCIASGTTWVNMKATGVDVIISAPQKGWSGSPCAGLVMLSESAAAEVQETESSSFALDLKQWQQIMRTYVSGKHAYHATLPTDGLISFQKIMHEIKAFGFERAAAKQLELGQRVRALLSEHGFISVAADGFQASGVVVCYTDDTDLHNGSAFGKHGLQIAAGVPLRIDEPDDYKSFRIGLFGLDKLMDVDAAVGRFEKALSAVTAERVAAATGEQRAA
ncbi:MAG: aminotransferase class V-fold PLP-dependent enzyme [Burkholderiaceae bacterium]